MGCCLKTIKTLNCGAGLPPCRRASARRLAVEKTVQAISERRPEGRRQGGSPAPLWLSRFVLLFLTVSPAFATTYFLTVAGLGGEPDYEQRFALLATDTDKILRAGGTTDRVIETLKGADATKAKMEAALGRIAAQAKSQDVVVLMMIGHGTFDGTEYKFNLVGP